MDRREGATPADRGARRTSLARPGRIFAHLPFRSGSESAPGYLRGIMGRCSVWASWVVVASLGALSAACGGAAG